MTANIIPEFPYVKANPKSLGHRKPVFGVGINDSDYITSATVDGKLTRCPFYQTWQNMFHRCYNAKNHARNPTYTGCTVSPEWYSFMAFREWMEEQDWQGRHLDKDLLVPGNQIYSPEACIFITQATNKLLTDSAAARGALPKGVCYHKAAERYAAQVSKNNGKKRWIGLFDTPEAASAAYKTAKSEYIRKVASKQSEPLRSALYNHAELIGK